MSSRDIDVVRRFNRSYTQRIGALDESFLGLDLSLGQARILYEIGLEPGTIQALRARLGLDSGYVSRLTGNLQARGLVDVTADPSDRRRRLIQLTPRGRAVFRRLDERSEARARLLVDPLSDTHRARLVEALATADLLVRAASIFFEEVSVSSKQAREATAAYFAELDRRFPGGFDAVDQSAGDAEAMSPPQGIFVVAVSDGRPVACGGVQGLAAGVGEIKRMWVHDDWRGAGLGARLLVHLENVASRLGHRIVRLDTNDTLAEAIELYRRSGYREIGAYNDNPYARLWFEKELGP